MAGTGLLALTHAEAGRLDAARAILDRAVTDERVVLPQDNFTFCGTVLFAGVAARCGRPAQRRVLRAALEPRLGRFCTFGSGGPAFGTTEHWMAELTLSDGDAVGAELMLVRADAMCQAAGATYWAVRARQRLAEIRSP
jgi:hypothetical protein